MGRIWIAFVVCIAGCVSANEERWRVINDIGLEDFARGQYAHALESFDYALTFRHDDPVILYNAAQCHDRLGNVKKAEELYFYCLQRDAKHGDARYQPICEALIHFDPCHCADTEISARNLPSGMVPGTAGPCATSCSTNRKGMPASRS